MRKTIKEMREKDQFFTKPDVSKKCIKITQKYIDWIRPSMEQVMLIEPSAGNGDFYYNFPPGIRLAFDIDRPQHINKIRPGFLYIEKDFLSIDHLHPDMIYIGNPPFGKSGKIAFEFMQKCMDFKASIIAFILPPNINSRARMATIKDKGYGIVHYEKLPDHSFYFDNGEKIDMVAESIFQIYMRNDYMETYNIEPVNKIKLKNNNFVQVYTINTNLLKNSKRDIDGVPFIQYGIGTNWIGKCDFYLPLRVFQSAGDPDYYENFMTPEISNIGFGIICEDQEMKNKINLGNCYSLGTNRVQISKKQLILKEIMRIYNEGDGQNAI